MAHLSYILFFIGFIRVSDACEITSSGVYTFGPSCQYMCHCLNGVKCDDVTGECSNGCQPGWYGPGCQFRDMAYKGYARHNSNMIPVRYADRANDGDITTCSYTNNPSFSTTSPWWRVWLPHNETIHELTILTNDDGKEYFTQFSVMVEYVPEVQRHNNDYIPEYSVTCYTSIQQENAEKAFNVLCEQPLIGNQIRIKLNQVKSQLVLCDVRVNGACDTGFWGQNCTETCGKCIGGPCDIVDGTCNAGCVSGYKTTPLCTEECENGTYGIKCSNNCNMNCKGVCDKTSGQCSACKPGWKGTMCDAACESGLWGQDCSNKCGSCFGGQCNSSDGQCKLGCTSGYKNTTLCLEACEGGKWGINCNKTCGKCLTGVCNATDGRCKSGCASGYKNDPFCTTGFWGQNCTEPCGKCIDGPCDTVDGSCEAGCASGYKTTPLCTEKCDNGTYGLQCNRSCNLNCDDVCDKTNGHCNTCIAGWKGTVCDTECPNGTYGLGCSGVCGYCKDSEPCDKVNGSCTDGCETGYEGSLCDIYRENSLQTGSGDETIVPVGAIGGGVSAVIVIVLLAIVGLIFWRRKQSSSKTDEPSPNFDNVGLDDVSTTYEEVCNVDKLDTEMTEQQNEDYYQFEKNRGISLDHLAEFVKTHLVKDGFFDKEFQKIPYGLRYSTDDAIQDYNAGKNRYKDIYAYDHSRVVLSTLPSNPRSDYINASYIKGYHKERAYIAAQGPTENTVDDFWRMVWEKDVEIIAMVTKLMENTKSKCIQYWASLENSNTYGDITVTTEAEEVFAELKCGVSNYLDRLRLRGLFSIHTRHGRIMMYRPAHLACYITGIKFARMISTRLVHGLSIAGDDQGVDTGYVDVEACVRNLREQRVNMVQKEAHYAFLYRAMVEALVLPSAPVTVDQFHVWYADQLDDDRGPGKTKLMTEFESMVDDNIYVTSANTEKHNHEEYGHVYQNSHQIDVNKAKNIYSNIIAADEFRPYLSSYVPATTNNIKAVYIPSYSDLHGYLITQTPLPVTAEDCCRLIIEQEIHVVVTFDDDINKVGIYLPSNGSVAIGLFNVTFNSKENKDGYSIRRYTMVYKSKDYTIVQFIYKKWPTNQLVPSDPNHVLEFLYRVDEQTCQFDNKPTMLQCLNGSERSGLFVVLMNVIERARIDKEVSIPQIIRYLRTIRQQIVPNYDQYKFCHDVMLRYAESNTTYSNV